jgi:glycosyltransferase involved in cell wall biosynthesis
MLTSWALSRKSKRKALYFRLAERSNMEAAACIRALTRTEAEDARRLGLRVPVCIVPNGVDVGTLPSPEAFTCRFPEVRGKRLITFMSRVLKSKGVNLLASAWARIERRFPEHHLVIAGPDFDNTVVELQSLISEAGISDRVSIVGMLNGDVKKGLLAASDLFALPSVSEGLSMAILEAMAAGLPILATRQCNFPAIREVGSGRS